MGGARALRFKNGWKLTPVLRRLEDQVVERVADLGVGARIGVREVVGHRVVLRVLVNVRGNAGEGWVR